MKTIAQRIDHFWFGELPAARLAVFRILVGAFSLQYLWSRFSLYGSIASASPDFFDPVGLARLFTAPMAPAAFQVILGVTLFLNLAFLLGWRHRITGPLFAGFLLFVLTYRNSWSMIYHSDNAMVLQALVLGLTRSADALSLDAMAGRSRASATGMQSGWPIRLICTVTVAVYFLAGFAKLTGPLGWSWLHGEALRGQLAVDGLRKEVLGGGDAPMVAWLYHHVWFFTVVGIGTYLLELGAPIALFHKWIGRFWALGILGMHWGILFLMGIKFEYSLSGIIIAAFFPLERLDPTRLPARRFVSHPTVFFDGVCGLCNATVDFIVARDREVRFRFSPLQSEHARRTLGREQVQELSTLILLDGNERLTGSEAFLRIAAHLGGVWRLAAAFRIIPRSVRDAIYQLIAANRYSWFGRSSTCRVPSEAERARFVL